jgi:hypothetical protein
MTDKYSEVTKKMDEQDERNLRTDEAADAYIQEITEEALRSGKSFEVGDWHIWFCNGYFRVSLDWSIDRCSEGDKKFASWFELRQFLGD